jgi:radical SAM superfamily enzyme YgiQ (UPF0313 family)
MTIREPAIDAICIGPGEETLMEYLDHLERSQQPQVDGIWYKDGKGNIIRNKLRPFKDNLDSLPFPNWDYWDVERYLAISDLFDGSLLCISSRGCPYQCAFCTNPAIAKAVPGPYYRVRSPQNVVEEIENNYRKYGNQVFKHVFFIDDAFGLNHHWLQEFCSLFIQAGLHKKLTWTCQTRADIITPAWAKSIRQAGCAMVILGIESGNEKIRMVALGKKITDKQVEQSIACLKSNDISLRFQMIMGMPGETLKTAWQSFKLIRKFQPDYFDFTYYQPFPRTELTKNMDGNEKNLYSTFFMGHYGTPFKINHNISNIQQKGLLSLIIHLTHFYKIYSFFKTGVKFNGFNFFVNLIRFTIFSGKLGRLLFPRPFVLRELFTKTVFIASRQTKQNL